MEFFCTSTLRGRKTSLKFVCFGLRFKVPGKIVLSSFYSDVLFLGQYIRALRIVFSTPLSLLGQLPTLEPTNYCQEFRGM
jgi:hypothetical protein